MKIVYFPGQRYSAVVCHEDAFRSCSKIWLLCSIYIIFYFRQFTAIILCLIASGAPWSAYTLLCPNNRLISDMSWEILIHLSNKTKHKFYISQNVPAI